jgi:predicted MFS family arabinose efflux permease
LINAERFGNNSRTLGLFLTAIAVGGVAASLFSGTFTGLSRPSLVMLGGSATWGAALTLFGLSPGPWAGLAFLVLAGAADTVSVVSRSAIVQRHTPTNSSAVSAPPNRSSGKPARTSATCAAVSSRTPRQA